MSEKLTLGGSLRWVRDHLPTFTVTLVTFSALWAAVVIACLTLYTWDATFYRSLAPPGMELTFMAAGVVFRTVVIFGGLAIVWIKQMTPKRATIPAQFLWVRYQKPQGADIFGRSAQTLRFLWVMGLIACCVAALGFVTEGNDFHYRKAAAVTTTADAATESADTRIARIEAEKAAVREDRNRLVEGARRSMDLVLDDGNSRNDDVSQYEANIRQYEADAAAKLTELDAQIAAIEGERLAAKQTATAESVGDPGLASVFRAPARYISGFDGVTFRDAFAIFWVILLEAVGSVGAQSLLAVQMALSKRKQAQANGSLGGKTTARRNRVSSKLRMIEDLRQEKARSEQVAVTPPPQDEPEDDDVFEDEAGPEDDTPANDTEDDDRKRQLPAAE